MTNGCGNYYPDNPTINIPKLLSDLHITAAKLLSIDALNIPSEIRVPSTSAIKISTVADAMHIVHPERSFNVVGVKASSDVDEQPLGLTTIRGALNRLRSGIDMREQSVPGEADTVAWVSIENGLFHVSGDRSEVDVPDQNLGGVWFLAEDADLATEFDSTAEYDDRAVVAIRIPGQPIIARISPLGEAVRFPASAVLAAYTAEGGLQQNTAGSRLKELGIVEDQQNPHTELTVDRPGGPLPRQDQMARLIVRSLVTLATQASFKVV